MADESGTTPSQIGSENPLSPEYYNNLAQQFSNLDPKTAEALRSTPPIQDPFANQKLEQGPPQPPPWAQKIGQIGDVASRVMMAMDPAQSIPYMFSQLPGPQAFLANHPQGADILSAITSLGLSRLSANPSATLGAGEPLDVSRFQKETGTLSPQRRGGTFFATTPPEYNFYNDISGSNAGLGEGGAVPVKGQLDPNANIFVGKEHLVEDMLPSLIGKSDTKNIQKEFSNASEGNDPTNFYKIMGKYGINKKDADITLNSGKWNVARERVVASVLRNQGYDAVMGSKGADEASQGEVMSIKPFRGYKSPVTVKSIGNVENPLDPAYLQNLQQNLFKLDPNFARYYSKAMQQAGGQQ